MCEPMGRREIFLTFSLLIEIEGRFTNELLQTRCWYEAVTPNSRSYLTQDHVLLIAYTNPGK
jgi:hypothetical protein